jgi:hypothetical protein
MVSTNPIPTPARFSSLPSALSRSTALRLTVIGSRTWPLRSTRIAVGPGSVLASTISSSSMLATLLPPTLRILSPVWSPASLAGDTGSPGWQSRRSGDGTTHSLTSITAGCGSASAGLGTPTNASVIQSRMNPRMKWVAEPALSTMVRFHTGYFHMARCSSPSGTSSSSGVIPTILTNAPAGIALTPYSVSPRLNANSVGPKPTKNRVTFIPNARADHMCPASCSATEIRMPSANSTTPSP